jgi:hypothetical protein
MTYFVTLDDKSECIGVYNSGELHFDNFPTDLSKTWAPTPSLSSIKAQDAEFAYFYCNGAPLDEVCPEELTEDWKAIVKKVRAHNKSYGTAKIKMDDHCRFDLLPMHDLSEFCYLRTEIVKNVFKTHDRPENYDFMKDLYILLQEMEGQKIKVNRKVLEGKRENKKARDLLKFLGDKGDNVHVLYDAFKTKTGRLSVKKGSFPILTMNKEFRSAIEPTNDWILELDYNAAELRTLLALAGKEQPSEDIHQWNSEILGVSRDEAKKSVISWLYGSKTSDIGKKLSEIYKREEVLSKYYDPETQIVTTPFGRKIKASDHHAMNYLVQSTTADLVFDRMMELKKFFKGKKSFIKFCLHDSVVIDLAHEEKGDVKEIREIFSNTKLDKFVSSLNAGENFGDLKPLNI